MTTEGLYRSVGVSGYEHWEGVTGVRPVNLGVFEVCSFAARGDWGGFV